MREYFNAYHSLLETMEGLNDAERGRLFTACLIYSKTGEVQELRGNERFVFPSCRSQIDRDKEKYDKTCEKNRSNVLRRYTTVDDGIRPSTKSTKEKEKEKEKTKDKEKTKTKAKDKNTGADKPPILFRDEWKAFAKMRKEIKSPLTDRAISLALAKLEQLAPGDIEAQCEIIDQSTLNGWKSFYPLKSVPQNIADRYANGDKDGESL